MIGFEKFFLKNIGKEEIKNLSLHPLSRGRVLKKFIDKLEEQVHN